MQLKKDLDLLVKSTKEIKSKQALKSQNNEGLNHKSYPNNQMARVEGKTSSLKRISGKGKNESKVSFNQSQPSLIKDRLEESMEPIWKQDVSLLNQTNNKDSLDCEYSLNNPTTMTPNDKPAKDNGFSHLEWSASVPYNLAEEPDEVQGMKHSHSCQSMPALENLKSPPSSAKEPNEKEQERTGSRLLHLINEIKTENGEEEEEENKEVSEVDKVADNPPQSTPKNTGDNDETAIKNESSQTNIGQSEDQSPAVSERRSSLKADVVVTTKVPAEINSSSSEDLPSSSSSLTHSYDCDEDESTTAVNKSEICDENLISTASSDVSSIKIRESQEALSKKLNELRAQSRSTTRDGIILMNQRPRAKSEEATTSFSRDSNGSANGSLRLRKTSEALAPTMEVPEAKVNLSAPKLVQNLVKSSNEANGVKSPTPSVTIPPPPMQFRDPLPNNEANHVNTAGNERARQIQKNLEEKMKQRRSVYEMQRNSAILADEDTNSRANKSKSFDMGLLEEAVATLESSHSNLEPLIVDTGPDEEGSELLFNPISSASKHHTMPSSRKAARLAKENKNSAAAPTTSAGGDTSSLSRLETRQQRITAAVQIEGRPEMNSYFLVERTGDCLETKSLPKPPPGASMANGKR